MSGVVVGVDNSETALLAARRAAAMAESLGEPLHIVMAIKHVHATTVRSGNEVFFDDGTQEAKQTLQRIKLAIGAPDATTAVGTKDPAKTICAEAEKIDAALIVVGNRRVQGAKRFLGAIATDVLRRATCDVLIAQTTGAVSGTGSHNETHSVASADIFRWATDAQRARLDSLATPVQVQAGKVLTAEGVPGKEFGVLLGGSATVTVAGEVAATLQAGDHFGEMALLDTAGIAEKTRSATVTANEDMWISVMSVQEFRRVLTEFPEAAEQLRRSAADRAALSQA